MQVLPPGVQHAQEADLRAQMLWVGGDLVQRLRRRPEQDVIDHGLVLERDRGDLVRHGEHDVEVGHVEQLCLTVFEPSSPGETLALRTVSVATRVVRDALMAAIVATLDMPPSAAVRQLSIAIMARRRAPDSDAPCRSRNSAPKWRNTSATSSPARATEPAGQAGTRSGMAAGATGKASSGLGVAQTLLVAMRR